MRAPGTRRRRPWLAVLLGGLTVTYLTMWYAELYLYVVAVMLGTPLFFLAAAILAAVRFFRQSEPYLRGVEVLVLAVGALVHVVAWVMFRLVSWA